MERVTRWGTALKSAWTVRLCIKIAVCFVERKCITKHPSLIKAVNYHDYLGTVGFCQFVRCFLLTHFQRKYFLWNMIWCCFCSFYGNWSNKKFLKNISPKNISWPCWLLFSQTYFLSIHFFQELVTGISAWYMQCIDVMHCHYYRHIRMWEWYLFCYE